jgi:hypothetical protein
MSNGATLTARVALDASGVPSGVASATQAVKQFGPAVRDSVRPGTDAIREHGLEWEKVGDKIKDVLKDIAVAAGLAVTIDKVVELGKAAFETAEKVGDLAQTLGVSTQRIQEMSFVAGVAGGNLDGVSESLVRLTRAQVEARDGNKQNSEAFRALGISITDTQGRLKPTDDLILEVTHSLAGLQDGSIKNAIAIQLLGRGAGEAIPFFNKLGSEYDELRQKALEFNLVLSSAQQKELEETQTSFNTLGQEIKGAGNSLALALVPAIKEVVADFEELLAAMQLNGTFTVLGDGAKLLAQNLGLVVTAARLFLELRIAQFIAPLILAVLAFAGEWISLAAAFGVAETAGALLATGMESLAVASRAALAAIGGIPGLIALAVVAIYELSTAEDSAEQATRTLKEAQDLLNNTSAETVEHDLAVAEAAKKKAAAQIVDTQTLIDNLEAQQKVNRERSLDNSGGFAAVVAGGTLAATSAQLDNLREHLATAKKGLEDLNTTVDNGQHDMKLYGEVVNSTAKTFVAGDLVGNTEKFVDASNRIHELADQQIKDGALAVVAHAQEDAAINKLRTSYENTAKGRGVYNSQIENGIRIQDEQKKDLAAYQIAMDELTGRFAGPYVKAQKDYDTELEKAGLQYDKDIKDQVDRTLALDRYIDRSVAAYDAKAREIKQIQEEHNLMVQANQDLQNQQALQGVAPQYQGAITDGLKKYDDLLKSHFDFYGEYIEDDAKLRKALDDQLPGYIRVKQAINDVSAAQKNQEQIQSEWQGIVSGGFDSLGQTLATFATGGFKSMHDFWTSLLGDAKQFIASIIQEMLKLLVFNGIVNSLFGLSGSSALPTGLGNGILGGIFNGQGIGGALATSVLGTGGGAGAGVSLGQNVANGGIDLSASGVFGGSAGGSVVSSLQTANQGAGLMGLLFGSSNSGQVATSLGNTGLFGGGEAVPGFGTDYGGFFGGETAGGAGVGDTALSTPATTGGFSVGTALNVAGAIFAGYNAYKAAGGGFGGVAAGAAYGTATYVAGGALAAGGAALAGGATVGAAASAGLAAIPVVGWVALALVAVNMLSGGKLFGTAGKVIGGSTTETVGPNGAQISSEYTTKGQRAFFGGAYYKQHDLAVDPKQQAAADAFYQGLVTDKANFAQSLGQTAGAIIGGTFVTTFDKKGKQTGTTTTIGSDSFKDETQQQFAERIQAANFADVLTKMGINVSDFTKGVSGDADKLLAATQDVGATALAAQQDIRKGLSLLGDGSTVADVVNETIKLSDGSATLAQTYANLQVESKLLLNDMLLAGEGTNKTGAALVEFANDAAKAAGGAQALADLITKFDAAFYSATQQAEVNISQLRKVSGTELKAIGENPDESMAQFKSDFDAIRDTLSPDQLVAWYQAGVDLAALNTAIKGTSDAAAKAQRDYANFEIQTQGDAFVQSFTKAMEAESAQIEQADKLAIAAGKAGASQRDLSAAITAGSIAVGQAIAQLSVGINNDIAQLFPKPTGESDPDGMFAIYNSGQAAQAQANAKTAQQQVTAYDLIQKLGDFAYLSGGDIDKVLAGFGLSADQIGSVLGESGDDVKTQVKAAEDQASSLITMAAQGETQIGLLTDMLEVLQGLPTTYDIANASSDKGAGGTHLQVTGKLPEPNFIPAPKTTFNSARFATPTVPGSIQPGSSTAPTTTQDTANAVQDNTKEVKELRRDMRDTLGNLNELMRRLNLNMERFGKVAVN